MSSCSVVRIVMVKCLEWLHSDTNRCCLLSLAETCTWMVI